MKNASFQQSFVSIPDVSASNVQMKSNTTIYLNGIHFIEPNRF